jgi:tetratricopeptide (TPR) repeat protein
MKDLWYNGKLARILLFGLIIALLGLVPLSVKVTEGFEMVHRAQDGAYPAAVAANLASIADQQPWREGLWEAAGQAAISANDGNTAGRYFARAAARGELSPDGYLAWGDADWLINSPNTALQIWEIAVQKGVDPSRIYSRQAEVYRAVGDDLALIEILKMILEYPLAAELGLESRAGLYYELGLLLAANDPASAPTYLSQAMKLDPTLEAQIRSLNFAIQRELSQDDPVYLLVVSGRALANLGHWDLAERAFENATHLHPEYAEAWAYLGEAQQHTNAGQDSLVALNNALELNPRSIAANTFMALYWQRQEDPERALEYLQAVIELDPQNPALHVEVGNTVALLGDLEAGREHYYQAMELSHNDPKYIREFLHFSIRFNLNLREVALPVARQLMVINPEDPASLDAMGEVLFHLGDTLNAERFYLRALERNPDYDQVHLHLGGLYLLNGDRQLAEYHYGRVLETSRNARTIARAQQALDEYFSP